MGSLVWMSPSVVARTSEIRPGLRSCFLPFPDRLLAMDDKVEGQGIASAILAEEPDAWQRFLEAYEQRLLGLYVKFSTDWQVEPAKDLVQGFLLAKVFRHADVMLGPCSRGEKPLWPRLAGSCMKFCVSEARNRAAQGRTESRWRREFRLDTGES